MSMPTSLRDQYAALLRLRLRVLDEELALIQHASVLYRRAAAQRKEAAPESREG